MERMGGVEWMGVVERVEEEGWMWLKERGWLEEWLRLEAERGQRGGKAS